MKSGPYFKKLLAEVERASGSKLQVDPNLMKKWFLHRYDDDGDDLHSCICGKTNIRYLYFMRLKAHTDQASSELLVGSECVKQFDAPESVALMQFLEKGISVQFISRESSLSEDELVFKINTKKWKDVMRKFFPNIIDENDTIRIEDPNSKVDKKTQAGEWGILRMKSDLGEKPWDFYIMEFDIKGSRKRVSYEGAPKKLTIYGKVWRPNPKYNMISKFRNPCKFCGNTIEAGKTRIMPCNNEGSQQTLWICYQHIQD